MSHEIDWPQTTVPKQILRFLDTFFALLDDPSIEAGKKWSDLFTENGAYLFSRTSQFHGREEIRKQRDFLQQTWPHMTHFVDNVYASDAEGHHTIVRGGWAVPQKDGTTIDGKSVAAYDLVKKNGELQIEKLEIYADPTVLVSLINGN